MDAAQYRGQHPLNTKFTEQIYGESLPLTEGYKESGAESAIEDGQLTQVQLPSLL